jgi:hypothetical protein
MKNKYFIAGVLIAVVALAFLGGLVIGKKGIPLTGGDFAGGILPSTLVTGSASGGVSGNGYVQPAGSLAVDAQNGLSIGGSDQYHGLAAYVSASGTPASVVTLGPIGATTSTATTSITVAESAGLSIGAICSGSSATTTVYVSGCLLNATNGATGTAVVAYTNITGAALAVPTSTFFRITFDQLPY